MPRLQLHISIITMLLTMAASTVQCTPPDSLDTTPDTLRSEPDRLDKFIDDLKLLGTDGLAYLVAPAHWSGNDWYCVGGTAAAIAGGLAVDRTVREEVTGTHFSQTELDIYNWGSRYGELIYGQLLTAGVYATGLALDHDDIRITGRMLAQSLLYSGAVTMSLRYLVGRTRPTNTDDPFDFQGFQKTNEVQSFPSGHTTVAFAVASVVAGQIDHPVTYVLLYGAATLTAVSRVTLNRHWVSDVVTGAVIGTSAGFFVLEQERGRNESKNTDHSGLQIIPSLNGLAVVFTF